MNILFYFRLYMQPLKSIQQVEKDTSDNDNPYIQYEQPIQNDENLNGNGYSDDDGVGRSSGGITLAERVKDIKNRIELRRMLAEYEAGNLKPPIFYRKNGYDVVGENVGSDYVDDTQENNNNNLEYLGDGVKRTGTPSDVSIFFLIVLG